MPSLPCSLLPSLSFISLMGALCNGYHSIGATPPCPAKICEDCATRIIPPQCPSVPLPRQTIHSGTFNKIKVAEHTSLTLLNEHDSGTGHQVWLLEDKIKKITRTCDVSQIILPPRNMHLLVICLSLSLPHLR